MSDSGSRRVEVEVSEETYERLERVAEVEGWSIEETVSDALDEYARFHNPDDPLFNFEPISGGEPVDVERIDEYLYGAIHDE